MSEQGVPAAGESVSLIFRGALAGAQFLVFVSLVLLLVLSMMCFSSGSADPCLGAEGGGGGLWFAVMFGLFSAPDLLFFWLLYSTGFRSGLKMAMVWGVLSVVLEVLSGGNLLVLSSGTGIRDDLGLPYCALHLVIAAFAGLAYVTRPSEALWSKSIRTFWAWAGAAVLVCGLALGLGWKDRQNWPGRGTAARMTEAGAVGSLRTVNGAAVTYMSTYEKKGYPESLAVLGPPKGTELDANAADLVGAELASGMKNGYRFRYEVVERDARGRVTQFRVFASPVKFPVCGNRNFMTDQSGVIRFTAENREASAQDSPLQ